MPSISKAVRKLVAERAHYCCEYCKTQEGLIGMPLVIDHIIPTTLDGPNDQSNLAAACYRCNEFKGSKINGFDSVTNKGAALFHPRKQVWAEHFSWTDKGIYLAGKTTTGRATVEALRLNNPYVTASRKIWVAEDWHPPL